MTGFGNDSYGKPEGGEPNYGGPGLPNQYPQTGSRPSNYLVWAILTTVLCCIPFGIVSIVYAAKVNGLWAQGLQVEAKAASDKAKMWAIIGAVTGLLSFAVYFALI